WINSRPDQLVAAFEANNGPLVIDYEHGTDVRGEKGEAAPAAGWINHLFVQNGEIWAEVEWTAKAAAMIAAREYRFISPVFLYDKTTGQVRQILRAGLTNSPRLVMKALNRQPHSHQQTTPTEISMTPEMRKSLCKKLGLADEASDPAILAAVEMIDADKAKALARADSPSLEEFVPRADHDKVKADLEAAQGQLGKITASEVEATVDAAVKAGKIAPATRDYHVASCKAQGCEAFNKFVEASPVITDGAKLDGKDPDKGAAALTDAEKIMANQLGLAEDQYAKDLATERAKAA
ncbi:MAG: phage protease, partial [Alphaproteobacteria bacterium]